MVPENDDPFDLGRFVEAQAATYTSAVAELRAGKKRGHWMWFIFPQLRGLGTSEMSKRFGIASLEEAQAYRAHPELGARLLACVDAVLANDGETLNNIFGSPDDMKFVSSMTLFAAADEASINPFVHALDTFCGGRRDVRTIARLNGR